MITYFLFLDQCMITYFFYFYTNIVTLFFILEQYCYVNYILKQYCYVISICIAILLPYFYF